jgi:hypothetical protein
MPRIGMPQRTQKLPAVRRCKAEPAFVALRIVSSAPEAYIDAHLPTQQCLCHTQAGCGSAQQIKAEPEECLVK